MPAGLGGVVGGARYWSHVRLGGDQRCWYWLGGLGPRSCRLALGDRYEHQHRSTVVVIAHRFGYAVRYGVDAVLAVPVVAHSCDNPLCQNPQHWAESDPSTNRRDWARRRTRSRRAAGGRARSAGGARAVRDAVRAGGDVDDVEQAGALPMHRDQLPLLDAPAREYRGQREPPRSTSPGQPRHAPDPAQLGLFDES